jgi:uncharacterized repeat protein (TIGR03803 family)
MNPYSALLQADDGNLYGTTTQGGESYGNPRSVNGNGFGTIFKLSPSGALTTLYAFHGTNGSYPYSSLVQGSDGNLYGTTMSGGAYTNELFETGGGYAGYGTLFKISTNGDFTTLVSFERTNGAQILGSLMQSKDGGFYGTTTRGGAYDLGTVFRLTVPSAPTIICPGPIILECGAPAGVTVRVGDPDGDELTVVWMVNGQLVQTNTVLASHPPATVDVSLYAELPLGTNIVAVSAIDLQNNSASCSTEVTVVDTTPPTIVSASLRPEVLWPPDHKLVTVDVTARVRDNCGSATWRIVSVRSDEPLNGPGDGNAAPDWTITGDHTVKLRAERSGGGSGRIYIITIQATDSSGNLSCYKTMNVIVPKNQRMPSRNLRQIQPFKSSSRISPTSTKFAWPLSVPSPGL